MGSRSQDDGQWGDDEDQLVLLQLPDGQGQVVLPLGTLQQLQQVGLARQRFAIVSLPARARLFLACFLSTRTERANQKSFPRGGASMQHLAPRRNPEG